MNWAQFKTILWLRWRLSRNQLQRSGELSRVLTMLILGVAGLTAMGGGVAGLLLGGTIFGPLAPEILMLVWDGLIVAFLFFWLIGLVAELQRSESIDLARLMHLPVSLRQVFVFNYLASHLTLSLIVLAPAMLGLALGLVWGRGVIMVILIPSVVGFLFLITSWTYCLRGWLAALMANQRRRRTIVVGIAMAMMLVGQLPNLYFNVLRTREPSPSHRGLKPQETQAAREKRKEDREQMLATVVRIHPFVPLLWLPDSARHLAEGRAWAALLEGSGCVLLGLLGLRRAYRTTLRYYQGDVGNKAASGAKSSSSPSVAGELSSRPQITPAPAESEPRPAPYRGGLLETQLRGIPEEAQAVALATFRSLARAPEVKMAFAMPLLATIVLGVIFLGRTRAALPEAAKPFLASGVVSMLWFLLFQFFSNQFGYDRQSFRTFVLSATDRRLVLLGKNLAAVPVVFGIGFLLLSLGTFLARLPVLDTVAALFQLVTMLAVLCLAGNCLSIIAPYRVQPGSMKAAKVPVKAMLLGLAGTALLPVLLLPVYIAPLAGLLWQMAGGSALVPVNLLLSLLLAGAAMLIYRAVLTPLGHLLQQREQDILQVVTSDLE